MPHRPQRCNQESPNGPQPARRSAKRRLVAARTPAGGNDPRVRPHRGGRARIKRANDGAQARPLGSAPHKTSHVRGVTRSAKTPQNIWNQFRTTTPSPSRPIASLPPPTRPPDTYSIALTVTVYETVSLPVDRCVWALIGRLPLTCFCLFGRRRFAVAPFPKRLPSVSADSE